MEDTYLRHTIVTLGCESQCMRDAVSEAAEFIRKKNVHASLPTWLKAPRLGYESTLQAPLLLFCLAWHNLLVGVKMVFPFFAWSRGFWQMWLVAKLSITLSLPVNPIIAFLRRLREFFTVCTVWKCWWCLGLRILPWLGGSLWNPGVVSWLGACGTIRPVTLSIKYLLQVELL